MSLQFILGASGSGKSYYMYNRIIKESIENPDTNYILLVPEQYSLALQRKMVMLHPAGGSMNIDVIGFNRLSYRVFDELSIKPAKVLEDFGKSMLIRQVAGDISDELKIYGGNLDKSGFIDEIKSLMSEVYQYDLSKDNLEEVIEKLNQEGDQLLAMKLQDILLIMRAFEDRIKEEYIVAEQLTELLYANISKSKLIANSVICLDGFTGFTPIQLKVIGELLCCAKKVYSIHAIDKSFYDKNKVDSHELFYLTKNTIERLGRVANNSHITIEPDIFIESDKIDRWRKILDCPVEKSNNELESENIYSNEELVHLEKNLFRYPYKKYSDVPVNIHITAYDSPRRELMGVAEEIKRLVIKEGYRYKDIGIITGNLEGLVGYADQLLPMYDIPYFLDYSRPIKNNPYIDAITYIFRMVEDGFSYDSVFAFLKSGVVTDISNDGIEKLENYVLARGIRGYNLWSKEWDAEVETIRKGFMDVVCTFHEKVSANVISITEYVDALMGLMDILSYEEGLADIKGLYDKLVAVLDKMKEIMGSENVSIAEFSELIELGLKDISMGMIPAKLDMITVGDITRTRLEDIKALFVLGVNDGLIPKKSTPPQIISDREKDTLAQLGFELAPTEKMNAFIEQFYLYINMTKPSGKLYLSYTNMSSDNEVMRPSYIVNRIKNIFPKLQIVSDKGMSNFISTPKSSLENLITGFQRILAGDAEDIDTTLSLYKAYQNLGYQNVIDNVFDAMSYNNIPENLSKEVRCLIKLNLASLSVSRLEQYANCAYAYFLKYTVGIMERKEKNIDSRDVGNILHLAMERLYRHVHDNMNNDWSAIDDEKRDTMVEKFVDMAYDYEYSGRIIDEGKYQYLRATLKRIGKRTAKMLTSIGESSRLKPELFEYKFVKDLKLSDGTDISLTGIVDRADVCYDPNEKELKLRIIDYKSGHHEFKINQLYEGLQLQLAVYMNIMLEFMSKKSKTSEQEDANVVPDGMYYYQMKDPYVKGDNEEKANAKREKELSLKGLVAEDKDYFIDITDFAMDKAKELAENIVGGDISKRPMKQGNKTACEYCKFSAICGFDAKSGVNSYKYPRFKDTDKDMVYKHIKDKIGGAANGLD